MVGHRLDGGITPVRTPDRTVCPTEMNGGRPATSGGGGATDGPGRVPPVPARVPERAPRGDPGAVHVETPHTARPVHRRRPGCGSGCHCRVVVWEPPARPTCRAFRVAPGSSRLPATPEHLMTRTDAPMSLHGLLDAVVNGHRPSRKRSQPPPTATACTSTSSARPAARPFTVAALARQTGRPVLAVTATGRRGRGPGPPPCAPSSRPRTRWRCFPSWETLPHERLRPAATPWAAASPCCGASPTRARTTPETGPVSVVVAPVRSVLQPQVKGFGDLEPVALTERSERGPQRDRRGPRRHRVLPRGAGREARRVRRTRRILDVFPPTEEHPLRVEFWGDDVEEIRYFKIADQRSLEVADHGLWAPPCRELLLTDDVRGRARRPRGGAPGAGRAARQDRRGHRGRGHGVPRAGPRRRHGAAARRPAQGRR
ncbi:Transcription-repair-coupling factor [Streptomyces microflavus]